MFNLPEKITKISSTPISKNGDATKDARDTRKYEKSQKFHKKNSPAPPIKNVMFPLRLLRDVKTSDIESLEHMYSRYFLRYLEGSRKPSDSGGEGGGQNDSFCFMRTVSDEEQDVVRGSRYNSIDFQGLANLTVKIYSDIQLAEDAPTTDDALKISRKNRQSEVTREVLDTLVRRSCSNANSADKPSKFITEVALAHASEYFRIESIGTVIHRSLTYDEQKQDLVADDSGQEVKMIEIKLSKPAKNKMKLRMNFKSSVEAEEWLSEFRFKGTWIEILANALMMGLFGTMTLEALEGKKMSAIDKSRENNKKLSIDDIFNISAKKRKRDASESEEEEEEEEEEKEDEE